VCAPKDVIDTVKSRMTIATAALAGALASPAGAQTQAHRLLHPTLGGQTLRTQLDEAAHRVLARRDLRLADAVRKLGGETPSDRAIHGMSNRGLRHLHARLVRDKHRLRREAAMAPAVSGTLQAIAACESGGDPRAIGGGGAFRGKYQFTYATWAAMGGSGDPAAAPEAEQDRLAAKLYATAGAGQWPVCGR
jgi:transglycosylase-like protein